MTWSDYGEQTTCSQPSSRVWFMIMVWLWLLLLRWWCSEQGRGEGLVKRAVKNTCLHLPSPPPPVPLQLNRRVIIILSNSLLSQKAKPQTTWKWWRSGGSVRMGWIYIQRGGEVGWGDRAICCDKCARQVLRCVWLCVCVWNYYADVVVCGQEIEIALYEGGRKEGVK